ncbi:hypothetical protein L3X38_037184 [Prunus dulcis]|uniref:Integrase catalytic domain-containing protein n=1 Tax=Prunus dulcis TaxID=3755 RepID=A0AAD4V4Z3_PRUDU|nr:hypothetical protein L3X38_037184 [Prunus dulcis]
MQWAIDLVSPLPLAPAKKEMMIVATDYFTKWIETKALSPTKEVDVERFIWRKIICRFGCPQSLVTDNGSQFIGKSTGETPFSLAYGTEAIIPPHITVPFISLGMGSVDQNSEQIRLNLDLLEGEREKTIIRVTSYQQQLKSYYDKKAKVRKFQPGDLVLRKAFITAQRQGSKKMNPNWEGERDGGEGRGIFPIEYSRGKICSHSREIQLNANAFSTTLSSPCFDISSITCALSNVAKCMSSSESEKN